MFEKTSFWIVTFLWGRGGDCTGLVFARGGIRVLHIKFFLLFKLYPVFNGSKSF